MPSVTSVPTRVPAPILVDSTEADVVEEALKRIPGKAIINSINLEDGEKRTSKVLPMAKRYGAAHKASVAKIAHHLNLAKAAHANGTTLRAEAVRLGYVTAAEFDALVRPEAMLSPS